MNAVLSFARRCACFVLLVLTVIAVLAISGLAYCVLKVRGFDPEDDMQTARAFRHARLRTSPPVLGMPSLRVSNKGLGRRAPTRPRRADASTDEDMRFV
jgi:hypothetical protein